MNFLSHLKIRHNKNNLFFREEEYTTTRYPRSSFGKRAVDDDDDGRMYSTTIHQPVKEKAAGEQVWICFSIEK